MVTNKHLDNGWKVLYNHFGDGFCTIEIWLFTLYLQGSSFTIPLVYVDDILLTGNNTICVNNLKKLLDKRFGLKHLGSLRYFLGLEVAWNDEGICLN